MYCNNILRMTLFSRNMSGLKIKLVVITITVINFFSMLDYLKSVLPSSSSIASFTADTLPV